MANTSDDNNPDQRILNSLKLQRRGGPRYEGDEYHVPLTENPYSPSHRDTICQQEQEVLAAIQECMNSPRIKYKFGTPTTRQEFDDYYAHARRNNIDPHKDIKRDEQMLITKGAIETSARDNAQFLRFLPVIIATLGDKIDEAQLIKNINHVALSPASITPADIDPSLTKEERNSVERHRREACLVETMLVSHKEDAPDHSPWAQRLHREATAKTLMALAGNYPHRSK